jgi:hypothetical protein
MASILLSFVGQQDPFSDKPHANETHQEGSIVTLVRYLIEQNCVVAHILLLHTEQTHQNAMDTRDWLLDVLNHLSIEAIELLPSPQALSQDPIDNLLAVQEARAALEKVKTTQTQPDILEFNASSGTPAMKNAWILLQAAGYAPHSRVWQIRNPKELKAGQARVLSSDVAFLKQEFDLSVVKQQVTDYNYGGALSTLKVCGLETDRLSALLNYGRCRMAFDFDKAHQSLTVLNDVIEIQTSREIAELRQGSLAALSRECYLNALTKLKNQEYAEFLTLLACFQENMLRALIFRKLNIDLRQSKNTYWSALRTVENGSLCQHLERNGCRLESDINIPTMLEILKYYPEFHDLHPHLAALKEEIKKRNNFIHRLQGTSEITNQDKISATMRHILKKVADLPKENPFDRLNQQIIEQLSLGIL